jgi:hypothetical protein
VSPQHGTTPAESESFTFAMPWWLKRLLSRNPLMRTSHRIEAIALMAAVVVSVLAVPIAGAVGTAVYDTGRQPGTQHATRAHSAAADGGSPARHPVHFSDDPVAVGSGAIDSAPTGILQASSPMARGDNAIVNDAGDGPTPTTGANTSAVAKAVAVASAAWAGTAAIAASAYMTTHILCRRFRCRNWERSLDQLMSREATPPG